VKHFVFFSKFIYILSILGLESIQIMKVLSNLVNILIRNFNVNVQENSYRHLMLIASLFVSIIGYLGFAIKSFSTDSILLFYVLLVSAILFLINLIILQKYTLIKFSSNFYIITFLLSMAYLVFDSGRSGYGYIWFYAIPIINTSILGVKRGSLFSFMFIVYLIGVFTLPDYYLCSDYNPDLKPRLIVSLFAFISLLFFREWAIELFKESRKQEEESFKFKLDYNKEVSKKLSNQIRFVSNEIIENLGKLQKNETSTRINKSLNGINESALNIINIINNVMDLSIINLDKDLNQKTYNLYVLLENVSNLFSSYKIKFNISINKNVPSVLNSNQIEIKQILYNIVEKYIIDDSEGVNEIDIYISKGIENDGQFEIKYQVVKLYTDRNNYKTHRQDCELLDLYAVEDDTKELAEIGLETISSLVNTINGRVSSTKNDYFVSVCFSQLINKNASFISLLEDEKEKSDIIFDLSNKDEYSTKKLNKMRVLLMEDNPITQKSIMFALDKLVKQLDIAENGKEGLDLFYTKKYDLILLDMKMPIIDGYEVAQRIRKLEVGANIKVPIVAVISVNSKKDIDKILKSGVDDYLEKPLKTNDLLKIVNKLLLEN